MWDGWLSLAIFYSPLINDDIIQPLPKTILLTWGVVSLSPFPPISTPSVSQSLTPQAWFPHFSDQRYTPAANHYYPFTIGCNGVPLSQENANQMKFYQLLT